MRAVFLLIYLLFVSGAAAFASDISRSANSSFEEDVSFFESFYLDPSCVNISSADGKRSYAAKGPHPLSARVVECIDGTMSGLFLTPNPNTQATLFQEFQIIVKPLVVLVLIFYAAMNGYLIATGQMLTKNPKQDIVMFIIKFILVFYFAVGDAWKDFFFIALRSVSFTLSTILLEAGIQTSADGCIFTNINNDPYPYGREYVALFDTLDCKFGNYIGWFRGKTFPILVPIGITFFLVPFGFVGQIIFSLVFTFTIQVILLLARITQLYLISIMVLTLMIYASPILVPMVLFSVTKPLFDRWLGKVLNLTVHPIMVFAFAGILLSVTDRFFYGSDPDANNLFIPYQMPNNLPACDMKSYSPPPIVASQAASYEAQYKAYVDKYFTYPCSLDTSCLGQTECPLKYQDEVTIINQKLGSMITSDMLTADNILNVRGAGGSPNRECYGGSTPSSVVQSFGRLVPLVCATAWLDGPHSIIPLPLPGFLELLEIYIPWRIDIMFLFTFSLALAVMVNLVVGVMFEKLEPFIDKISGANIGGMQNALPDMASTTQDSLKSGFQGIKEAHDQTFSKRESTDSGKEDTIKVSSGGEGGGGSDTIKASSGGGGGGGGSDTIKAGSGGGGGDAPKGGSDTIKAGSGGGGDSKPPSGGGTLPTGGA